MSLLLPAGAGLNAEANDDSNHQKPADIAISPGPGGHKVKRAFLPVVQERVVLQRKQRLTLPLFLCGNTFNPLLSFKKCEL